MVTAAHMVTVTLPPTYAAVGYHAARLRGAIAATRSRETIRGRQHSQLACVERWSGALGGVWCFAGNTVPSTNDGNQNQFAKQIDQPQEDGASQGSRLIDKRRQEPCDH
jgi:hypothetical protein